MQVWPEAAKIPAQDARLGGVEVGVGEDDVGGFAAELERRWREYIGCSATDRSGRLGPPVKAM